MILLFCKGILCLPFFRWGDRESSAKTLHSKDTTERKKVGFLEGARPPGLPEAGRRVNAASLPPARVGVERIVASVRVVVMVMVVVLPGFFDCDEAAMRGLADYVLKLERGVVDVEPLAQHAVDAVENQVAL